MKVLFVMLLVGVKTINCERATNKNTRETIDFAKMKKELEDQKASLEKHATALEQQSKTNTNFRKVLRKEFRNKMEKEKIVNVELRKADATKRQRDVAEITRNFIASEVENYLANSGALKAALRVEAKANKQLEELAKKDEELTAKNVELMAKVEELTAKDVEWTAKEEELTAKVEELIPAKRVRLLNALGGSQLDTVTKSGRLEVWFKGEWGTVCSDRFDDNDAFVVCSTLGFTGGAKLYPQGYGFNNRDSNIEVTEFEVGQIASGPIWIDEVACTGFEQDFLDCPRPIGLNVHDCGHHEDVFMKCT